MTPRRGLITGAKVVKYFELCKFKSDLRINSKKSSTFAAENGKVKGDRNPSVAARQFPYKQRSRKMQKNK